MTEETALSRRREGQRSEKCESRESFSINVADLARTITSGGLAFDRKFRSFEPEASNVILLVPRARATSLREGEKKKKKNLAGNDLIKRTGE